MKFRGISAYERTVSLATSRKPFGWQFVSPLLLGSALNPINSSMIATALIGIGTDFNVGPGTTASLISVLYLCSAVSQPTMGKISSLVGARRTFVLGVVLLFIAGVLGTLSPSFGALLLSRALIGIATSACYPTAMSLIRRRADSTETGVPTSVIGDLAIAAQITATFGLPLGGLLVGVFGWRVIFAVNIPLSILTVILTLCGIPKDDPWSSRNWLQFLTALDVPGIALFASAITSLLLLLSNLESPVWWLAVLFVVLATGLFIWEKRVSNPLIDVRMLSRNMPLQRTYLRTGLVSLGNYAALFGVSQWMEQGRGLSAETVGLILLPLSGFAAVVSRVTSKGGWVWWPLIIGGVAQGSAGLVLLKITHDTSIFTLVGAALLLGCYAFGSVGNQTALYIQSPPESLAVASGLYRTSNYIGAIFSSSLIAIAYGARASDAGLHNLAFVLVVIGFIIVLLSIFDSSLPKTAK